MSVQETDLDESFENIDREESDYSYIDKSKRKVYIEKIQFSIYESYLRFKKEEIILRPDYQQLDVWTSKKKSRLIESVLLNISIPIFYLAELKDEKKVVFDGQQRLIAFFDFLKDEGYPLEKLDILDELTGKAFKQLSPMLQRKFEDFPLTFFLIKKESHPDILFDVFRRVNDSGAKLNAQEFRNILFQGDRVELLKELAQVETFKQMIEKKLAAERLKDHEAALRFLAFHINGYEAYNGNLNSFLNSTIVQLEDKKSYDRLKTTFRTTMETILCVFGKDAFIKGNSQKQGINLSLFDILSYSFSKYDKSKILNLQESIKKKLNDLTDKKTDFYNAITFCTLTRDSVKTRFAIWLKAMEDCINKG
jgi:hypothetical protein